MVFHPQGVPPAPAYRPSPMGSRPTMGPKPQGSMPTSNPAFATGAATSGQLGFAAARPGALQRPGAMGTPQAAAGYLARQPTGAGGVSNATPAAPASGWDELSALQNDIMKSHQASWAGIQQGVEANTALNARRASEMNAGMGRNIAGGFGGMMAQAQLGGQQNLINARSGWEKEGRGIQMDWLDKMTNRQNMSEAREFDLASEGSGVPTEDSGAVGGRHGMNIIGPTEGGGAHSGAYVLKRFNDWAGDNMKSYTPAQQQSVAAYVESYYKRNGRYPSNNTISHNVHGLGLAADS